MPFTQSINRVRPASPPGVWLQHGQAQAVDPHDAWVDVSLQPISVMKSTSTVPISDVSQDDPGRTIGSVPFSQPSMQTPTGDGFGEPPTVTPGQLSQSSQANSHRAAYLGESGFMSMFRNEPAEDATVSHREQSAEHHPKGLLPVLQESYFDTYSEYCYTFCPILDRSTMELCSEFGGSLLLREALALLGSHLNPPLMPHPKPRQHYLHVRRLFYDNHEDQPLIRICAIMLLYWWSTGPPNVASIDTNWWWMGASIRLAQEIGIHREQDAVHLLRPGESIGLRRRIWWTLFVGNTPKKNHLR